MGHPHKFDVELLGYSDEIVETLCRLLDWEIPTPDPTLLGPMNLPAPTPSPPNAEATDTPNYEFVPPCRYMFNGAKERCASSSDEEEESSESQSSQAEEEGLPHDVDISIDDMDTSTRLRIDDPSDDEHLVGSGSEFLRPGSFEDTLMDTEQERGQ